MPHCAKGFEYVKLPSFLQAALAPCPRPISSWGWWVGYLDLNPGLRAAKPVPFAPHPSASLCPRLPRGTFGLELWRLASLPGGLGFTRVAQAYLFKQFS